MPQIDKKRSRWLNSLLSALLTLSMAPVAPMAVAAAPKASKVNGDKAYRAGQVAEARGDYDEAFKQYELAVSTDQQNPQYLVAAERTRFEAASLHVERGHKLRDQGNLQDALSEYQTALAIDPSSPVARQSIEDTQEQIKEKAGNGPPSESGMPSLNDAMGPPTLRPLSRAPINLRVTNDSKIVMETIGKLAGINVLFDPDYVSKRITVELDNVSLEEALDQVMLETKSWYKPLTQNTIFVMPDTAVKRREEEQQIIKTFYLSNPITPQDLTEVVTAIRTLLETRRIMQINSMNAIMIRDTPAKVALAEKIIRDVDKAKPEVVVDVEVLEVSRDKANQLGLSPGPGGISIPLTYTPGGNAATTTTDATTGATTTSATTQTIKQLGHVGSGDFSVTLPGATLTAILSDAHTKILQRPELRATDGMKASLKIGNRIPIATGAYQPGVAGQAVSALVNTQFQYIDVGVNMDIQPKIHEDHEVSMKVRVEISSVTSNAQPVQGVSQPVIGQRVVDHDIRLREGEINVLGGILETQDQRTISGIPGLSQIPLLKYLFSNVSDTVTEDEVLIVMSPHIVRMPDLTALNLKSVDIGTEEDVHLREPDGTVDGTAEPPAAAPTVPAPAPTPAQPAPTTAPPAQTPASPTAEDTPAAPASSSSPAEAPAPSASAVTPTDPASYARLRLPDMELNASSGGTFEVPVRIENAENVANVPFELLYDPTALKLVDVQHGNFLAPDGQPVAVVERPEEDEGRVMISLNRPPDSGGVSGSDTLAVLTFEAAKPTTTALSVVPNDVRNTAQQFVPVEAAQATVVIR